MGGELMHDGQTVPPRSTGAGAQQTPSQHGWVSQLLLYPSPTQKPSRESMPASCGGAGVSGLHPIRASANSALRAVFIGGA